MKICYLASKFPPFVGGGETVVYLMAKHLSQLRHNVTVITGVFDNFEPYCPQDRREKFKMKYIPGFEEFCTGIGGITTPLSLISQTIKKIKPDIIHVHNLLPQYLLSPIIETLTSKIVLSYHNTPNPPSRIIGFFPDYNLDYTFAKHIFTQTKFDSLVATSKFYQEWAIKLGVPENKTHLIYSGIDTNNFHPEIRRKQRNSLRQQLKLNQQDILVTLPARIIRRKGVIEAIKAVNEIKKQYPSIKLCLPGLYLPFDPDFAEYIKNLIKRFHLSKNIITCKQHLSLDKMPLLYAATDICICPSYYEGLGLSILESLSMEIPTIGTGVSGIDEILINENNGLVVPPKNYKKLAKAIVRLISQPKFAHRLGVNGRQTILTKFDSTEMTKQLESHYRSILNK